MSETRALRDSDGFGYGDDFFMLSGTASPEEQARETGARGNGEPDDAPCYDHEVSPASDFHTAAGLNPGNQPGAGLTEARLPNNESNVSHQNDIVESTDGCHGTDVSGVAQGQEEAAVARHIPDISGMTRLDAARAYMAAGIAVFPVDGKMPAKENGFRIDWDGVSTTDTETAARWGKAWWFPGGDAVPHRKGMAVDLGKSAMVCIDVDRPERVPEAWWPVLDAAPFTSTDTEDPRRGHYFFAQPQTPVGCPKEAWGEVKGIGGYVVLAPSPHAAADREWPDKQTPEKKFRPTARYQQVRTGELAPLPELIAGSFGEHRAAKAAASFEEVAAFMEAHDGYRDDADPKILPRAVHRFREQVEEGHGRHPSMISALTWIAKAARGGLVSAALARDTLESVFIQVKGEEIAPDEFEDMWEWAVGQATDEDTADYLSRRAQKMAQIPSPRSPGNTPAGEDTPAEESSAPEPIDLLAPEAEPYDMRRFGSLGAIAQAFADGLGVSADMTVVGMLAAASTACGGKVYVYVDERDWKQPVVFQGINLAPAGGLKSDSGKICWKPVMDIQKERREATQAQAELDEMYRDICDSRIEKLKKDAVRASDPEAQAEIEASLATEMGRRAELKENQTASCRLWANDTTPEALIENMARQKGRMAILDTEPRFLKIMAGGVGKKGGNPDPSVMLAGYDQDAGSRDRITNRTEVILEKPTLTIGIFTQPKRFASIAADNIEMDAGGAWGRFFFSVPGGTRYRTRDFTRVSSEVTAEHDRRIRAMFAALYDSDGDLLITLTPEAEELFLKHWMDKDPSLMPQEYRVRIEGWDDKEEGRALRIATLLELYDDPHSRVIGVERIRDVIAISETMRTHARAASEYIATMEGDPLAPAREVHEWLREEMPRGVVTATSVLRALRRKRSKTIARMDHVIDALRVLEDYNWIRPALLDDKGSGDLRMFMPHPVLRSPAADGDLEAVTQDAGASGDPAPEEPEAPQGKIQALAQDVRACVLDHCDTQTGHGQPGPPEWRVQAVKLYDLVCRMTGRIPTDEASPVERDAIPEDQRIDKIRFSTALREAFPSLGSKRTGKGAGKVLWFTGIRFKPDRE